MTLSMTQLWRLACSGVLALAVFFSSSAGAAVTVTDDTGYSLTLEKPVQRVIGLYGTYSEIFVAMGLKDLLVGRTNSDAGLDDLPAVGTHMRPNPELIVSLRPDVVFQLVGRSEVQAQTDALRALGVQVLNFRISAFEDLFRVVKKIGAVTGKPDVASELIARWKERLKTISGRVADEPRQSVFFEVRYPNLLAAGEGSIVHDIIVHAGGENVIQERKKLVRVNEEVVIAIDPDGYIVQHGPMNSATEPVEKRRHFQRLNAVRNGRVLQVEEALFSRPGPHSIDAVEMLARWLHPACFKPQ